MFLFYLALTITFFFLRVYATTRAIRLDVTGNKDAGPGSALEIWLFILDVPTRRERREKEIPPKRQEVQELAPDDTWIFTHSL